MALSVKKVEMWQKDVTHKVGSLAGVLAPLADVGADLQVVMGYGTAGGKSAVVSLFPVKGKKPLSVAESAKLKSSKSVLLVQGDNKAGLGNSIAQALAGAGINIAFLSAMAMGKKFVAAFGFGSEEDTEKATALIKKAAAARKPAAKPAAKTCGETCGEERRENWREERGKTGCEDRRETGCEDCCETRWEVCRQVGCKSRIECRNIDQGHSHRRRAAEETEAQVSRRRRPV